MQHRSAPRVSRKKAAGFTAIEVTIAILIGIIILAAAGVAISKMFNNADLDTEVGHYTSLLMNTKGLRSQGNYGASGTNLVPSLIATDSVPKTMTIAGSGPTATLRNTWDGTVTVVSTGSGFDVTTPAVPKAECIQLATKISGGGAVSTKINTGTAVNGAVSTAAATTGCSLAANTLVFGMPN